MKFTELEIHPNLIKAAERAGFEELTSIQEQALEPALAGRDIAGLSQTGTGKTLAFLLPILHTIYEEGIDDTTALIVTPTRELCVQIAEEAEKFSVEEPLRVTAIYGGEGYARQEEDLRNNPHIIVATPGRLIDYMKQKKIDGSSIRYLVLDEADRMFDMGFIRDIRYIIKFAPQDCRKFLFSATLSYYVMRLASEYMVDPVEISAGADSVAVENIEQSLYHLGRDEKSNYLANQIINNNVERGIVFTNLKTMVPVLVNRLRRYGIPATGISSLLDQKKRIQLLKKFKTGKYHVLIATDVASRGLDIDDITHVFNYDLPQDSESYVHRIGRTARAGKSGVSISYCSEADYENLPRIQRYLGMKIPLGEVESELLDPPQGDFTPFDDGTVFQEERGGRGGRGGPRRDGRGDRGGPRDRDRGRDRDRNSGDRDRGRGRGDSDRSRGRDNDRDRDRDRAASGGRGDGNRNSGEPGRGRGGRGGRGRNNNRDGNLLESGSGEVRRANKTYDARGSTRDPDEDSGSRGNNRGEGRGGNRGRGGENQNRGEGQGGKRRRGRRGGRGGGGNQEERNRDRDRDKERDRDRESGEGGNKRRRRRGKKSGQETTPQPEKKKSIISKIVGIFKKK